MWYSAVACIVTLVLSLLAAPLAAEMRQPAKVPRIGILIGGTASSSKHVIEAFRQGLRDLGYLEGQNIVVEYRWAEGKFDRFPAFAAEFVKLRVDLIVAPGGLALDAARHATDTIPIVVTSISVPVVLGYVNSLARPGGNITGISVFTTELSGKRLELLKDAVPGLSRVAILLDPSSPNSALERHAMEAAGRALGLQLQFLDVRGLEDFALAFAAAARGRAEALITGSSLFFFVEQGRIVDFVTRSRLPAMFAFRESAEAGGLMSYGASIPDAYGRVAYYVDRILKGARPTDLPVEQPRKFDLLLNLKTARTLGVTFPPTLLILANEILK